MVCSNCGYENPSEHRYCGMCGTPFPHRALTVPGAQSTLEFISTPVGAPPNLPSEPIHEVAVETETIVQESVAPPSVEAVVAEASALSENFTEDKPAAPAAATQAGALQGSPARIDTAAGFAEEQQPRETLADVPPEALERLAEAAPVLEIPSPATHPALQDEVAISAEPGVPPVKEPEQPLVPPAREPEPEEPEIREPEPEAPEVIREPPPRPDEEPVTPTPPVAAEVPPVIPPAPQPAAPRVLMPPPLPAETPAREISAQEFAKIHPPPDSLPLTSPPPSSGMPTFKEVSEASGPPPISPFEPPKESHTSEDQELQEFVASFHWTPPAETADELTMRSEVPVIDKEAPAEFHHPSFDGDEVPPPEAGPHPTGKEYYSEDGTAPRSRFLDVGKPTSSIASPPAASGSSILGIDATRSIIPPEELAKTSRRRWLWGSILAIVAIFGGLGYWEGQARSTHAFRGPVEIAREGYSDARPWLRTKMGSATAAQQPPAPETLKPTEPERQNEPAAQPANSQGEAAQPNSASDTTSPPKDTPQPAETQPATMAAGNEPTATVPPKPLEAPLPKTSTKPQPGQQELAKAMQASDSAATAAWLWKATSRGNPDAPVRLADMYIKGNGVPKSCEQALVLLRAAAMKENAPARNRLAALYANGNCVVRDPVRAYQLMSSALAADPASDWAKENRQVLWNQMTPQQRAEAEKPH